MLTNEKYHPHQPCQGNNDNLRYRLSILLRYRKWHLGRHELLRLHPPFSSQRWSLGPHRLGSKLHLPRHHVRRPSTLIRLSHSPGFRRKSFSEHSINIQCQHHGCLPNFFTSGIANGHYGNPDAADWERKSVYGHLDDGDFSVDRGDDRGFCALQCGDTTYY